MDARSGGDSKHLLSQQSSMIFRVNISTPARRVGLLEGSRGMHSTYIFGTVFSSLSLTGLHYHTPKETFRQTREVKDKRPSTLL